MGLILIQPPSLAKKAPANCESVSLQLRSLSKPASKNIWLRYFEIYQTQKPCLDGYYGEQVSEMTATWLELHWISVRELKLTSPEFRDFLAKSPNASLNETKLTVIQNLAKEKCPKGLEQFCQVLSKNTSEAIQEIHSAMK